MMNNNKQILSRVKVNGLYGFADAATISGWAVDHIKWAVGHQIMAGKPGNLVDPKGTATRAEMATMIYRLMSEVIGDRY